MKKMFSRLVWMLSILGLILSSCRDEVPDPETLTRDSFRTSLYLQNAQIQNFKRLQDVSVIRKSAKDSKDFFSGFWIDTHTILVGRLPETKREISLESNGNPYTVSQIDLDDKQYISILENDANQEGVKFLEPLKGVLPNAGSILHCMANLGESQNHYFFSVTVAKNIENKIDPKNPSQAFIPIFPQLPAQTIGGACLDLQGNLAGIIAGNFSRQNLSFLLPINYLNDVLVTWDKYRNNKKSIQKGIVPIPLLTIQLQEKLNLSNQRGVIVSYVEIPSIAHDSGIQRYDFIQKVNQTTVQNQNEFYLAMKSAKLNGESIVLQILRDGKNMDVRLEFNHN